MNISILRRWAYQICEWRLCMGDAGCHDARLCAQRQNNRQALGSRDGRIQPKRVTRNCRRTRDLSGACGCGLYRSRGSPFHSASPRFPMARRQRIGHRYHRLSPLASLFLSRNTTPITIHLSVCGVWFQSARSAILQKTFVSSRGQSKSIIRQVTVSARCGSPSCRPALTDLSRTNVPCCRVLS
jgi:hypothetical protein